MERITTIELPEIPHPLIDQANQLYLEFRKPGLNLIQTLERIYSYLDGFGKYVATFATCQKGCNYCCHYDVQITSFEAEYIYLKTGIPHNPDTPHTFNNEKPCPFLASDGQCGIYQFRPMVCRTFHAVGDPKNCAPGKDQLQYGSPQSDFGNPIYKNLVHWMHFQTMQVGGHCKDIRDFFPYRR